MPPELSDLADHISLTPYQALGIPIALIGAVFLSLGAQFQHRGVGKVEVLEGSVLQQGLTFRAVLLLLRRPSWVLGTVMLALAVAFQLTALYFAPLIVVQPLGAIALVITAILNARLTKTPLGRKSIRSIVMSVAGVGAFVTIAAFVATSHPVTQQQLITILITLAALMAAILVVFVITRHKIGPFFYIVVAGILFGFVATLAKVVIDRVKVLFMEGFDFADVGWLTWLCLAGLIIATLFGGYFQQTAYANGPPDLVIAGLTVIDPLVAITIGVVVLNEASAAPPWAIVAFIIVAVVAVWGVVSLSRNHPQVRT